MTRKQVDQLETLIGQLVGMHTEISALGKKSPTDAVNKFKLGLINSVIKECNEFLGDRKPLDGFTDFDEDAVPSNSDVTFVLAQYAQALEKYRSDNISTLHGRWFYNIDGGEEIRTAAPAKLKE